MTKLQLSSQVCVRELHDSIAAGCPAELLDVRTPSEFAEAHVPGAQLVPLDQLDPAAFLKECGESSKPIYVLCQSGARAARAIEKFKQAGFEHCVLVVGGTQAWIDAGLPVSRGEHKGLPLMRQVQMIVGGLSAVSAGLALTVNIWFALIPLVLGTGLFIAGATGFCGLAIVLAKMPWNKLRVSSCSIN